MRNIVPVLYIVLIVIFLCTYKKIYANLMRFYLVFQFNLYCLVIVL